MAEGTRKFKINEILSKFENDEDDDNNCFKKTSKRPKNKITKKSISVIWRHKRESYKPYELMKDEFVGTNKLSLDTSINYSLSDIITLTMMEMKNDKNKNIFDNCEAQIGYSDNTILKEFLDKQGIKRSFWDWINTIKSRNGSVGFYLLTRPKEGKNQEPISVDVEDVKKYSSLVN